MFRPWSVAPRPGMASPSTRTSSLCPACVRTVRNHPGRRSPLCYLRATQSGAQLRRRDYPLRTCRRRPRGVGAGRQSARVAGCAHAAASARTCRVARASLKARRVARSARKPDHLINLDGDLAAGLQLPCPAVAGVVHSQRSPVRSRRCPATVVPAQGEPGRLVCASEVALGRRAGRRCTVMTGQRRAPRRPRPAMRPGTSGRRLGRNLAARFAAGTGRRCR
jgi:hypothetical protein